jgi:hypothetical protein
MSFFLKLGLFIIVAFLFLSLSKLTHPRFSSLSSALKGASLFLLFLFLSPYTPAVSELLLILGALLSGAWAGLKVEKKDALWAGLLTYFLIILSFSLLFFFEELLRGFNVFLYAQSSELERMTKAFPNYPTEIYSFPAVSASIIFETLFYSFIFFLSNLHLSLFTLLGAYLSKLINIKPFPLKGGK